MLKRGPLALSLPRTVVLAFVDVVFFDPLVVEPVDVVFAG
jgi:hypothetical protein